MNFCKRPHNIESKASIVGHVVGIVCDFVSSAIGKVVVCGTFY